MPKRKNNVILTAKLVILRDPALPDATYLTADGAADYLNELRNRRKHLHATALSIEQYTSRGKLTPAGYFNGIIPLYTPESIQALAQQKRRSNRDPQVLTAVEVTEPGDTANPDAEGI